MTSGDSAETVQAGANDVGANAGAAPKPTRTVECNRLTYTDGDGVKRDIHMPKGTAKRATALYVAKDWAELAKYPAWNNQQYTEDDYITVDETAE